jgi:hypothetical protein
MAEIIEAFSTSKSGLADLNEDAFVITDRLVAVIDGETNKGAPEIPSPGRKAALAVAEALEGVRSTEDPFELVTSLHRAVRQLKCGTRAAAVVAVLDLQHRRVIRVGGIAVGFDRRFSDAAKELDRIAAAARAEFLRVAITRGLTPEAVQKQDPGREWVLPLLIAAREYCNDAHHPFGYGSINGSSTPQKFIEVLEIPRGTSEVVLASDGYREPKGSLAASEQELAELRASDPLRIGSHPGLKAFMRDASGFDDRTYIRVLL